MLLAKDEPRRARHAAAMEATMAVNAAAAETMRQAEMFFTWMESVLDLEEQEEGDGEGDRVGMGPGVKGTDMYGGHTISAGAETSVAAARVAATAFADDGHSAHAPTTGAGDVDGGGMLWAVVDCLPAVCPRTAASSIRRQRRQRRLRTILARFLSGRRCEKWRRL